MNNQTERLLTFASEKMVTEEGFYYRFGNSEIDFLPSDGELFLTLTFEGQLKAELTQYDPTGLEFTDTETFSEETKITEILKWLKSKIK